MLSAAGVAAEIKPKSGEVVISSCSNHNRSMFQLADVGSFD